jgi:tetratricopeptide (TPR) repeat protein
MTRQTLQASRLIPILFLSASVWATGPRLPEPLHQSALACIDFIYKENFKQAEQEAKKIIKCNPDHPAGYFFYAAALDSWMCYYQSTSKEEAFYEYCDKAIEKGKAMLDKNPDDVWARFFVGGADGYKGTYESRLGRWITAFRYGWQGTSVLLDLNKKHPELTDVDFGVGCYEYWRSAMSKSLYWMPGVNDEREIGIEKVLHSKKNGVYTQVSSSVNLIDILFNEKRYDEALVICDEMLKCYPTALVFLWTKGKMLIEKARFSEAENVYRYILSRVESENYDNHYNAALCHLYLAKILSQTKRYTEAIAECNRMTYYNFGDDVRKRLESCMKEVAAIKTQVAETRAKNPQVDPPVP